MYVENSELKHYKHINIHYTFIDVFQTMIVHPTHNYHWKYTLYHYYYELVSIYIIQAEIVVFRYFGCFVCQNNIHCYTNNSS